ncbi:MAG: hypothetical protein LBC23_05815 [Coriobacteriales bacterium]|jgi:hypothetical protein|nr:hypothetical protein [Coriobacteriales bacterium]
MRMKARLQLVCAFALLGAFVAAGVFLPAQAAARLDSLLLEKVEAFPLASDESKGEEGAVGDAVGDATGEAAPPEAAPLAEGLGLLALSSPETLVIQVETGRNLSSETVMEVLNREVDMLRARGLYPLSDTVATVSGARSSAIANFYVRPSQPDANGIIWVIHLEDKQFSADFFLDDESEKVLVYWLSYEGAFEDLFAEQVGKQWLEYLGLSADGLEVKEDSFEPPLESDASALPLVRTSRRFWFTQETNGAPLEFYCEQSTNGMRHSFSLSISSLSKEFIPPAW